MRQLRQRAEVVELSVDDLRERVPKTFQLRDVQRHGDHGSLPIREADADLDEVFIGG